MLTIRTDQIALGVRVEDHQEAIQRSGQILVDTGLVQPAYIDSMLRGHLKMTA